MIVRPPSEPPRQPVDPDSLSPAVKAVLGAFLEFARAGELSLRELAAAAGVDRRRLWEWTSAERRRRLESRRPRVDLLWPAPADPHLCDHPEGRIPSSRPTYCLACTLTNIEGHPLLRRHPAEDPPPEPRKTYAPGDLRGGRA